jgi:predicted DNA repair protein MutK
MLERIKHTWDRAQQEDSRAGHHHIRIEHTSTRLKRNLSLSARIPRIERSSVAELTVRHQIHLGVVLRFLIELDVLICTNL